jgi:hypothetical protein
VDGQFIVGLITLVGGRWTRRHWSAFVSRSANESNEICHNLVTYFQELAEETPATLEQAATPGEVGEAPNVLR